MHEVGPSGVVTFILLDVGFCTSYFDTGFEMLYFSSQGK